MSTTFTRTLAVAAKILGSQEALHRHLSVTRAELGSWMKGRSDPPAEVFLRVVDVVLDDNGF